MGIEVDALKSLTGAWTVAARRCDSCKTASSAVFCRVDSAFLCLTCDSRIHGTHGSKVVSRHDRVWMCEVCEQAPAAVTCKADAAALCVTCDSDIHSANPLAQRHERVPVEPFFDSPVNFPVAGGNGNGQNDVEGGVSWLLPIHSELNPKVGLGNYADGKAACDHIFFSEMDQFLDFEYGQNSIDGRFQQQNQGTDSVVPVQSKAAPVPVVNGHESCVDIDFCRSKLSTFNYPSQSLSQSVSSSSLDVGVVPDGSSMSEITHPFIHNINGGTDPGAPISGSTSNQPTQLCGIDREARVLRYREKRKNRKFEKTIRYASRKAYAETRPRIKGRFAKRTEIESHMDRLYNPVSVPFMAADSQYGVVPSF